MLVEVGPVMEVISVAVRSRQSSIVVLTGLLLRMWDVRGASYFIKAVEADLVPVAVGGRVRAREGA
jgi:hypothetical protein